ncbi:MAG: hypothetical protein IIB71_01610 [Proteobacteria bacterium]|nr:hypothetical protein [Pseudomonadota bacterium]
MADQDLKIQSIDEKEIMTVGKEQIMGPARFEAKNLSPQLPKTAPPGLQQEAKSPEDIRRKIEAQKYQSSGGKASFSAKDL